MYLIRNMICEGFGEYRVGKNGSIFHKQQAVSLVEDFKGLQPELKLELVTCPD
jgi:hypothetical protein